MARTLHIVDFDCKGPVYILCDDEIAPSLHAVDMGETPAKYPNHLRAWRLHRRMTQEALAEAIGSSKAVIGFLENGDRRLSDKWLRKLAPVLNTSSGYLLDHDPNDLPTDILDLWSDVPDERKAQAKEVLATFTKTGTGG